MPSHPNRSKNRSDKSSPKPAEIRAARERLNLTEKAAAELIHCTAGGWVAWERGDRRMHPAFFELFRLKTEIAAKLDAAILAGIAGDPDIFQHVRQARASLD